VRPPREDVQEGNDEDEGVEREVASKYSLSDPVPH